MDFVVACVQFRSPNIHQATPKKLKPISSHLSCINLVFHGFCVAHVQLSFSSTKHLVFHRFCVGSRTIQQNMNISILNKCASVKSANANITLMTRQTKSKWQQQLQENHKLKYFKMLSSIYLINLQSQFWQCSLI